MNNYSVYSYLSAYLDTGLLGVYAGIEPAQTVETIRLILVELAKLTRGDLDEAEVNAAREHLKGNIILGAESIDNRMTRLAKNEITYRRYVDFDEILDAVAKVSVENVVALANEYLRPEDMALTVLGPIGEADLPRELLFQ